ncbi:arf-GAP domain and FG repeat-containing protein 2 isoform X2 [Erpetoichthys calabaricus]|uniref:arf-GAP domain and FG repeat-containing protein 2 isoform X2 n=1 Tax=Erpetoichthys calabaricus TaxID=27687 RepID=UPI002234C66F|nr:arf-GAP domain and FG repeat-containing protein 2 isoform X2 [Erpetoichthys calabaricus]
MSASNRKPKDNQEIFSKRVRELGKGNANRQCFECEQPGVTYVDITVGSFVCTSCSGILRGLNPPHRVKSISMTTFSQQEVEFLQAHGNEVCSRIWLGTFDRRTQVIPDSRDPRRLKEFLQDKYEKKKWAVSPDRARTGIRTTVEPSGSWSSAPNGKKVPSPKEAPTPLLSISRPTLSQSVSLNQSQLHRAPPGSLTDLRTDAFTALPHRPFSYGTQLTATGQRRSSTGRSPTFPGFDAHNQELTSSGVLSPPAGAAFPALPRPTASGTFRSAFPFGGNVSSSSSSSSGPGSFPPPGGLSEFGSFFGNRLSSSTTPSSSPGVTQSVSTPSAFPVFSNPFGVMAVSQPPLSPTNPFLNNSTSTDSTIHLANTMQRQGPPVSSNPFTGAMVQTSGISTNPFL